MKIEGFLKHQVVIILIDTESTDNFMDNKVVARLMLQIEDCNRRMQMEKRGAALETANKTVEEELGGGGVVTQRGKLCRRCKETFNSSSNTPSSCRFHPSFFVCRRHDDQKRYVAVPPPEPSSLDGKYLLLFRSPVLEAAAVFHHLDPVLDV
ncbi:hypothetical protein B296_00007928 [Ensete ventricosum]|uniref:Uncharacterized protein n=1 Tax=Ensete ventricosum TaxID=4639 RepID=A0A426ZF68_ENSVE|nr:hypothetical protein B296_00007928 [Ensete ventricosum]